MKILMPGDIYRFTPREIGDVAVTRYTQLAYAAIVCGCCWRVQMIVSRDTGITDKWSAAASVIDRLRRGQVVNGRLE